MTGVLEPRHDLRRFSRGCMCITVWEADVLLHRRTEALKPSVEHQGTCSANALLEKM